MPNRVKQVSKPNYTIDAALYKRFDQRRTVFGRMLFDDQASFFRTSMYDKAQEIIAQGREEYTRVDFARILGSWTVYDHFHGAFSKNKLTNANNVMDIPQLEPLEFKDSVALSSYVKETAHIYGASSVGICPIDPRWVYSYDMDGIELTIPTRYTNAIVMTISMNPEKIATSPSYTASIETGQGYSRMAYCVACLAQFIRYLGYQAMPMGNDTALSIPLAIDAGLGELGRLGLLITPQDGPCVRLCKVFTDLPLVPDKPISFGVGAYCQQCSKCVEVCEVDAISRSTRESFDTACPSNNAGVKRWAVNHDRCYEFWIENGSDCSKCIAACPFTPGRKY